MYFELYDSVLKLFPQVIVTFSDFETMERVCSVLLEKLDKSVCVGTPRFYHSAESLGHMRYKYTHLSSNIHRQSTSSYCG